MYTILIDSNTGPQGVPWHINQMPDLKRILRHHKTFFVLLHFDLGYSYKQIRKRPGVYLFMEVGSFKPIRIGESSNLRTRIRGYFNNTSTQIVKYIHKDFKSVWCIAIETPTQNRFALEK